MEDGEGSLHIDVSSEGFDAVNTEATNSHSDGSSISLEISNAEEPESSSVATFVDGQAVQLEDGRTARIYRRICDAMDSQYLQFIDLDEADGTTSYIQSTSSAGIQTEPSDEDKSPNFKCEEKGCGKLYQSSNHLRAHKRSHTSKRPFKCQWKDCGKSFSTSYTLKSHTRVHTGEKPYDCTYGGCKKAFKTAGDLQKHTRTHTGEKPFKCPVEGCGKAFTTSNICKVHLRTHTGERPYKCPFQDCEKTFSTATNYKNHVRIHTGEKPFLCEWPGCGRRFTEYSSYYKHQVVHTDRNIFSCCHCGKFYAYSSTLLGHKKTAHNDDSCRVLISERVRAGKRKKPAPKDAVDNKVADGTFTQDNKNSEKSKTASESGVILLPVRAITSDVSLVSGSSSTQVAAVVTASSVQPLAILSRNGTSQQFTLSLTDHGSTLLLPQGENTTSVAEPKVDEQVIYIGTSEEPGSGNMMSMMDKDNTLQRMEASEGSTSADEATSINADIWLHQPQNEDISAVIEVKEESTSKDGDDINIHFESSQNPCEDGNQTDSIAYLEIGGAKYQLKIVPAESDPDNQICLTEQPDSGVQGDASSVDAVNNAADDAKFNVQSFLNSAEAVEEDAGSSEPKIDTMQYSEDRLDPEGSQRCEPFCKKKKL